MSGKEGAQALLPATELGLKRSILSHASGQCDIELGA